MNLLNKQPAITRPPTTQSHSQRYSRCIAPVRCQLAARSPTASASHDNDRWARAATAALSSLVVLGSALHSPAQALANTGALGRDTYVYDAGRLLNAEKRDRLDRQLQEFSSETGWNLRLLTTYGPGNGPSEEEIRAAWGPLEKRSIIVLYDATAPALISVPYLGDDALAKLRRPWWFEFKGRFGNIFYVREQGEQSAILESSSALLQCLGAPAGCAVVPGLPEEQWALTAAVSAAGGLVAGLVSKLESQGIMQRRWVALLLFSPVWGSLFINFGLGPVVSRTDDKLPVAANTAAFLAGAALPYAVQVLRPPPLKEEQQ